MRNLKIFILTSAIIAAVLAVAAIGMTDVTAGGSWGAMSNTSSVTPAPLGTYSIQ